MNALDHILGASLAEQKEIVYVQMGVLSPDDITAQSVVEVTNTGILDPVSMMPKQNGLMDAHLGTCMREVRCFTCKGTMKQCPGHFGSLKLARPVLHFGFLPTIVKILRCLCHQCSKIRCSYKDPEFMRILDTTNGADRLDRLERMCHTVKYCQGGYAHDTVSMQMLGDQVAMGSEEDQKTFAELQNKERTGCEAPQLKYTKDRFYVVRTFLDQKEQELQSGVEQTAVMDPREILRIFERMDDDTVRLLGMDPKFAHPKWLVLTVLPFPPPPVRPSVSFGSGLTSDDLTFMLSEIVKTNKDLRRSEEQGGQPEHLLLQKWEKLQYCVATYFNNEIQDVPPHTTRNGKALKSIRQRLHGKAGRIRGNLMGKRVNFSARTVITGDPNLGIDYIGVPKSITKTLTFPEIVNSLNIEELQACVRKGPFHEGGANKVIRPDCEIDLAHAALDTVQLAEGFVVERHIRDEDYILFNRQPTLHKMSLMGHKVKVMPYSTFRLNLACTSPYNADFDGDEMNMHVPQTWMTRAEAKELMLIPRMIVSPQANKPVIGIIQDTLLGCYKLSQRDTFLKKDMLFNTLMLLEEWDGVVPKPCILHPEPLWSGKQVFSLIIPRVNYRRFSNGHPDDEDVTGTCDISFSDTVVRVEKGELLMGTVDKTVVGKAGNSLIHVTYLDQGPDAARRFLGECQKVVNYWLLHHGFSVGVMDTIAPAHALDEIAGVLKKAKDEANELIDQARRGLMERQPGRSHFESFEEQINDRLNRTINEAGGAVKSFLTKRNNLNCMVSAGSKGGIVNICQIISCIGQTNVSGKRVSFGFRDRTLPHFTKEDLGPEARGFVENSYLQGLTPSEFFFHAMGGREGLVDTAVKTADTGYLQRKLIKTMEDTTVAYDGTVRGTYGEIIQFVYGEDAMDGVFIEKQKIGHVKLKPSQFQQRYLLKLKNLAAVKNVYSRRAFQKLTEVAQSLGRHGEEDDFDDVMNSEYEQLREDVELLRSGSIPGGVKSGSVNLPVHMDRLIESTKQRFLLDRGHGASDNMPYPHEIVAMVRDTINKLVVVKGDDLISREAQRNAIMLFSMMVRCKLAAKRVLLEHMLDRDALRDVLSEIVRRFHRSKVHVGEMVGPLAAMSIGEPTTQLTLNTFHFAGVSAKRGVTQGVPRFKEVIHVNKTVKTPSLTVYLEEPYRSNQILAQSRIMTKLEYTTLKDIVTETSVWYDPDYSNSVIQADREWLEGYDPTVEKLNPDSLVPFVLRMVVSRALRDRRGWSNQDVVQRLKDSMDMEQLVIHFDNSPNVAYPVFHFRIIRDDSWDRSKIVMLMRMLEDALLKQHLGGIRDITKVVMRNMSKDKKKPQWILDTEGVDLAMAMAVPGVDFTRTISNHCQEIFEVLGIEAARMSLLGEIREIIKSSSVNYRHLAMLIDTMTFGGYMMSVNRFGINRTNRGPLGKCTFEETVEILLRGAMFAERDDLRGVSQNVLLGKLMPNGTGYFDLFMDMDCLEHNEFVDTSVQGGAETSGAAAMGDDRFGTVFQVGADVATPGFSPDALDGSGGVTGFVGGGQTEIAGDLTPGMGGLTGFSPGMVESGGAATALMDGTTPNYSPTSVSHVMTPTATGTAGGTPSYGSEPAYSPTSPANYSPTSPVTEETAGYSQVSPNFSPTDGASAVSPDYSAVSPMISPTSGVYSPTSPALGAQTDTATATATSTGGSMAMAYSPTSPATAYSPTSPAIGGGGGGGSYSPTSPAAAYSPTSPAVGGAGDTPVSPAYSYGGGGDQFSPVSPAYATVSGDAGQSPVSPDYESVVSPGYGGGEGGGFSAEGTAGGNSPVSPHYTQTAAMDDDEPVSPAYNMGD